MKTIHQQQFTLESFIVQLMSKKKTSIAVALYCSQSLKDQQRKAQLILITLLNNYASAVKSGAW